MSLTSLLIYNPQIKSLFADLPNLKPFFHTLNEDDTAFPPRVSSSILVKRTSKPNSAIGHAYDYWLRAWIQRINGLHEEKSAVDLTASAAIKLLSSSGIDFRSEYVEIIRRRNDFISGQRDDDPDVLRDCMQLAYLDVYYRAGYMPEPGFTEISFDDIEDLSKLANETKNYTEFFTVRDLLICNPGFGIASLLVDGADADLIIDGTLIEIKTESTFGYKASHVRQLLGYYLLSRLTPSFKTTITRLAVFNPRYCRYIYLDLDEVAEEIDLDYFMDRFVMIICSPAFAEDNNRATPTIKQIQTEIMQVYQTSG